MIQQNNQWTEIKVHAVIFCWPYERYIQTWHRQSKIYEHETSLLVTATCTMCAYTFYM